MSIISDLAALARAGFTPSAIKEILDAEETKAAKKESDSTGKDPEEPDYKKLYEDSQKELNKTKEDLVSLQADNTKIQVPDETLTIDEIVKDIAGRI